MLSVKRNPRAKVWAEHFPSLEDKTKALCGERRNPIVLDMMCDNDPDMYCKRCKNLACPDCKGTGYMGGGQSGIYCPCHYGTLTELRDGGRI